MLLIASAWTESLSYRSIKVKGHLEGYIAPGIITGLPEIKLVGIPQASLPVQKLLQDIAQKHQSYEASSDFRALAHYPEFLGTSWNYLRPYVGSNEYTLLKSKIKRKAIDIVHNDIPFPVYVVRNRLDPFMTPANLAGSIGLVSMFRDFLPDLIIDIEFIRRMMYKGVGTA